MLISAFASLALAAFQGSTGPELTVYNQGFALVKELRQLTLKQGRQGVNIEDVASSIDPTSVGIRSIEPGNAFEILEQNYQYDLISPQAILNKSVGKRVRFIRSFGNGQKETVEGVLLSSPSAMVPSQFGGQQFSFNGMVIRTNDGRIILDPMGEVEVMSIPEGLISKPTLQWEIIAPKAGPNAVELSYVTNGMSWNADYVLTLDGLGHAGLQGWVTMNNNSGATYKDATLKLLAGDVNMTGGAPAAPAMMKAEARGGAGGKGFQEESLFEYHLYTLQRPATIKNKEIKQLSLLEGQDLTVTKKLTIDSMYGYSEYYPSEGEVGTGNIKPLVTIEFKNSKDNHMGMPLPQGRFRVYQRDKSGSVQMLGEDRIVHTPKDEIIKLNVGRSFDIVADRKRMNFRRLAPNSFEETFQIEVRNRKDVSDKVYVMERHWGDWKITSTSMPFEKLSANTQQYVVDLQAGETKKITYTVQTKW